MAKSASWIPHVEAFVDSSTPEKQAASVNAIAELLKADLLGIPELVREMDMYLTTTDHVLRGRGILLLGELLTRLVSKPLDSATVHFLLEFFTARLSDWQALRGALVGSLALLRRGNVVGAVLVSDARALANSFFQNLQVQLLALHDRKLCFELVECFLAQYAEAVVPLAGNLVDAICEAIDEEKDPRCLMIIFHIVELLGKLFPDPSGPLATSAEDLFEILCRYFPIYFTHPKNENVDVKRDDLSRALMHAFGATPFFEPHSIPVLLDKLSSSLPLAKLDSLKYLGHCALHYGADRMQKHAKCIWSSLKETIWSSSQKEPVSLLEEKQELQDDEITREALTCLQQMISFSNVPEAHTFRSLIMEDEDMERIFKSVVNEKVYGDIRPESKHNLYVLARILAVSSRVSRTCCSRVFQCFFLPLLDVLGLSSCSGVMEDNLITRGSNFGALYLCVEIIASCMDHAVCLEEICEGKDLWVSIMQSVFMQLVSAFEALLLGESVGSDDILIYLGVKGLKMLALLSHSLLSTSKETFENILMIFMSIITSRFQEKVLWKLSLKSLVEIGAFVEKACNFDLEISFMTVVVDKVTSLLLLGNQVMPLALKLEALSEIGASGVNYMLRVIQGMEGALRVNVVGALADGEPKSGEILLGLLECYANRLLPWLQETGGFEEVAVRLAFILLDHTEAPTFKLSSQRQDVLDAASMVMRISVSGCSPANQSLIIEKAYRAFSSCGLYKSKEVITLSTLSDLESLACTQDVVSLSCRDEWIISLLASVIIALHPGTPLPEAGVMLKLFVVMLVFKGHSMVAQALGSIVNKGSLKANDKDARSCTLEGALEIILEMGILMVLSSTASSKWSSSIQIHAISALAWVAKGLLMRGHAKVKDIVIFLLDFLLPNTQVTSREHFINESVVKAAADAFFVVVSDTNGCLNKKFHATIRPLYKQHLFSSMMPIFLSSIKGSGSSFTRAMLYRAFGHVISETPLAAIVTEARRLVPVLLEILSILSQDNQNKDLVYSLVLVLSGILMDENANEAVLDNVHNIVGLLVKLVSYPHMTLVRETAIQCLVALSELPHSSTYSMRHQVLQATSKALDDRKRIVRREAVRCRQTWASTV